MVKPAGPDVDDLVMPRRRLRLTDTDPTSPSESWQPEGESDGPPVPGMAPVVDILPGGGPVPAPVSLHEWLERLPDLPRPVHRVVPVACRHHEGEPVPLSRVEADPVAGVARRRCEACDDAVELLDSAQRWTAPPLWACPACGNSQLDLAAGLSLADGEHVDWVVLAGRCAACHAMSGLTDILVSGRTASEVIAAL